MIKNKKITTIIILLGLFLVSLFLRLYRLDQNIPHMYADEILGHYEMNHLLSGEASIFQLVYRWIYFGTQSLTWLFGLTPLGVRSAAALVGSFMGVAVFLLSFQVSNKNLLVASTSGILAVILPWSYMVSRIGYSPIPLVAILSCLHVAMLIKAKTLKDYILSLIPIAIAGYYYLSMVIIAPLAALLTLYLATNSLSASFRKKLIIGSVILISVITGLVAFRWNIFSLQGRGMDLTIWRDTNVTADSNLYRGFSRNSSPSIFSLNLDTEKISNKILFNYQVSVVNIFVRNYLSFFSPDFLFLKGDNVLRHSTGMVGSFFPFLLPFMIYGAFEFFKQADKKLKLIFLVWILISPIPGAITKDGASYLLRVITLMPFLTYFSGLGIVSSLDWFKTRLFKAVYATAVVLIGVYSTYYFFFGYFHVYPALSAYSWEYGFKQVSQFNASHGDRVMLIIWENQYSVFCFWNNIPYEKCDPRNFKDIQIGASTLHQSLPNLFTSRPETLIDYENIIKNYSPEYIAIPKKYLEKYQLTTEKYFSQIETIHNPGGEIAFIIFNNIK